MIATYIECIALLAAAGRMHGISSPPVGTPLWEVFIAGTFRTLSLVFIAFIVDLASNHLYGLPFSFDGVWSALWFATGHGNFYAMKGVSLTNDQPELLERLGVRWLWQAMGGSIYRPTYSWWCMSIKGLLISLPLFPWALGLDAIWPLFYVLSFKYGKTSSFAEYSTAATLGALSAYLLTF